MYEKPLFSLSGHVVSPTWNLNVDNIELAV